MAQHLDEHDRPFLGQPMRGDLPPDRRPLGAGRALLALLIFALALAATTTGIGRLAGDATGSIVAAKLREIADDAQGFDVAFIGNSHAYRGIDPLAFDRAMSDAGQPVRSYNLAAQGMTFPELDATLRRLVEQRPRRLRWILIDLSFRWLTDIENLATRRVVWWHDAHATRQAIELVLASGRTLDETIVRCVGHLRDYVNRLTHRGVGIELLERLGPGADGRQALLAGHERGFQALVEHAEEVLDRRRQRFLSSVPQYLRAVWQLAKLPVRQVDLDRVRGGMLSRTAALCRQHGLRVLFYMPPALTDKVPFPAQAENDLAAPLEFNQPKQYPQLYHVGSRFDASHLNAHGAGLFARYLAGEFARVIDVAGAEAGPDADGDD